MIIPMVTTIRRRRTGLILPGQLIVIRSTYCYSSLTCISDSALSSSRSLLRRSLNSFSKRDIYISSLTER